MIDTLVFFDAYHKLLHNINPKLTGLKEDEYSNSWGKRIFKKPWMEDSYWLEVFNSNGNKKLKHIKVLMTT